MKKIIAAVIICLTIFGSCYYFSKNFNKAEHSISVQWNGEVYVTPDTLILSFRVEETAPTTAEAQKNANEKIDKVKEIIKQYDVESSDIKSTNINVYEQYDWTDSGRIPLWYTASHTLEVKIRKANIENEWIASKIISEVSEIVISADVARFTASAIRSLEPKSTFELLIFNVPPVAFNLPVLL